jgi:hypothetical protein
VSAVAARIVRPAGAGVSGMNTNASMFLPSPCGRGAGW